MNKYGSRKFIIITLLTLLVNVWLVWERVIDAATFKAIILGTVGVYIAGNVAQRVWSNEGKMPAVDLPQMH